MIISLRRLKKADTALTKLFDAMSGDQVLSELDKLNEEERVEIIYLMKRNPEKYLSVLRMLDKTN